VRSAEEVAAEEVVSPPDEDVEDEPALLDPLLELPVGPPPQGPQLVLLGADLLQHHFQVQLQQLVLAPQRLPFGARLFWPRCLPPGRATRSRSCRGATAAGETRQETSTRGACRWGRAWDHVANGTGGGFWHGAAGGGRLFSMKRILRERRVRNRYAP
jgi:hypothetical protein